MMKSENSPKHFEINWIKILKSIILKGRFALMVGEISRRLYSDRLYYMFRRDLTLPLPQPKTNIPLTLRQIDPYDIQELLNLDAPDLTNDEVLERIKLLRLLKLAHFPQLVVHKEQNSVGGCQKVVEYQPPFFEDQM